MRACIAALYCELAASGYGLAIIPANVCPTLVTAIHYSGTNILLAPTDPETGAMADDATAALIRGAASRGSIMMVQSYGFLRDFPETLEAARSNGWLVVENDTMATRILTGNAADKLSADVLLTSFGPGKAVSAGVGGAALFRDSALAGSVGERVQAYPAIEDRHFRRDVWLIQLRRLLRQGPDENESWLRHGEFLMALERDDLCHSLPEKYIADITGALDKAPDMLARRREKAADWATALDGFDGIRPVGGRQINPWRSMWLVRDRRDKVVAAIRRAGFDAGTNYPDVREYFPTVLPSGPEAGARQWTESVLNLWLDDRYDRGTIRDIASIIGKALA